MSDEKIDILTGEYVTLSFKKAEVMQRVGAVIIDWFLLGLVIYLYEDKISSLIGWPESRTVERFLFALIPFVNLFVEYTTKGYTLGKKILGIRIISDECVPPSFLQCFMRWLLFSIDFWGIGFFFISTKGQRLGDMASGCQCIREHDNTQEKVNIEKEFKYLAPKYKVLYPEAIELTEKEIGIITKVLYYKHYQTKQAETANEVEARLKIKRKKYSSTEFLEKVLNDYKYLTM